MRYVVIILLFILACTPDYIGTVTVCNEDTVLEQPLTMGPQNTCIDVQGLPGIMYIEMEPIKDENISIQIIHTIRDGNINTVYHGIPIAVLSTHIIDGEKFEEVDFVEKDRLERVIVKRMEGELQKPDMFAPHWILKGKYSDNKTYAFNFTQSKSPFIVVHQDNSTTHTYIHGPTTIPLHDNGRIEWYSGHINATATMYFVTQ